MGVQHKKSRSSGVGNNFASGKSVVGIRAKQFFIITLKKAHNEGNDSGLPIQILSSIVLRRKLCCKMHFLKIFVSCFLLTLTSREKPCCHFTAKFL